jgi:hypothetical protein
MNASPLPPDAERELDALRRRAYGPHSDIQTDPAALARLTELEAARSAPGRADTALESGAAGTGAPPADSAQTDPGADEQDPAPGPAPVVAHNEGPLRSRWHHLWDRVTATRARRNSSVTGALVVFLALSYSIEWLVGPRPDATLHPLPAEADEVVFSLLYVLGADVDRSSLRGYERYRGFEPWFAVNKQGQQCFMIVDRSGPSVDGANCVPSDVDLFADIGAWPLLGNDYMEGLPDGSILRFHYRGDSVEVVLYPPPDALTSG